MYYMSLELLAVLVFLGFMWVSAVTFMLLYWVIEVKAMMKSTHRIAYMSPDFEPFTEKQKEEITKDPFENIN